MPGPGPEVNTALTCTCCGTTEGVEFEGEVGVPVDPASGLCLHCQPCPNCGRYGTGCDDERGARGCEPLFPHGQRPETVFGVRWPGIPHHEVLLAADMAGARTLTRSNPGTEIVSQTGNGPWQPIDTPAAEGTS
jgi:hypothetical protein